MGGIAPGSTPLADAQNPTHVLVLRLAQALPYASASWIASYVPSFVESAVAAMSTATASSAGRFGSVRPVHMALANALLLVYPGYQLCSTYAVPGGVTQRTCRRYGRLHLVVRASKQHGAPPLPAATHPLPSLRSSTRPSWSSSAFSSARRTSRARPPSCRGSCSVFWPTS